MTCDESYEIEDGGIHPIYRPKARLGSPPSIFWDANRESRLEAALREIEIKFNRPPTPLEKAVASIEAQFGKGAVRHAAEK